MFLSIVKRIITLICTLTIANVAIFAMIHASGDPLAGFLAPGSPPTVQDAMRQRLGLERPLPEQAVEFLANGLTLDFGDSWKDRQPAIQAVLDRMPASLALMAAALLFALIVGHFAGILAVSIPHGLIRSSFRLVTILGQALPAFWLGTVLVIVFAVELGWLPSSGNREASSIILPAITLGTYPASVIARLVETGLREARGQAFVTAARARGNRESAITWIHILPNAILPTLGYLGLQIAFLAGGAIVIESVFAWPGLGRFALQAAAERDLPVIQATVTVIAVLIFLGNAAVDLAAAAIDPRLRPAIGVAHG